MSALTRTEPAITTGTITAAVGAILALLVVFGLDISADQTTAILAAIVAIAPIVSGILTRRQVVPSGNVAVKVQRGDELTDDVLVAGDGVDLPNGAEVDVVEVDPPQDVADPVQL